MKKKSNEISIYEDSWLKVFKKREICDILYEFEVKGVFRWKILAFIRDFAKKNLKNSVKN